MEKLILIKNSLMILLFVSKISWSNFECDPSKDCLSDRNYLDKWASLRPRGGPWGEG